MENKLYTESVRISSFTLYDDYGIVKSIRQEAGKMEEHRTAEKAEFIVRTNGQIDLSIMPPEILGLLTEMVVSYIGAGRKRGSGTCR